MTIFAYMYVFRQQGGKRPELKDSWIFTRWSYFFNERNSKIMVVGKLGYLVSIMEDFVEDF